MKKSERYYKRKQSGLWRDAGDHRREPLPGPVSLVPSRYGRWLEVIIVGLVLALIVRFTR